MSSESREVARSSAAWRIAGWPTVAFAIGSAVAFAIVYLIIARDIRQRSDEWLSGEAETLVSCHRESIHLADQYGVESLSFPAISTGAFGYPLAEAAPIAVSAAIEGVAIAQHVTKIRFVLFDDLTLRAYTSAAENLNLSNLVSPFRIEKTPS